MQINPGQSKPGGVLFALIFLALAVFLLIQLPTQTRFSATGQLFAQPRFWPGVGVSGMVGFGAVHLAGVWRARTGGALGEALVWLRAFEFFVWFMAYVTAVPVVGYLAATLAFTTLLARRMGYRSRNQIVLAGLVGFAIVVVFKTLLAVKIPGGAIYDVLPGSLRAFMILNF